MQVGAVGNRVTDIDPNAEADGAIVGSSIVKKVEEYIGNPKLVSEVGEFARWLRGNDPSLKK